LHTRRKPNRKLTVALFFIPVVIIGGVLAYAFVSYVFTPTTGTLYVAMEAAPYRAPIKFLQGTVGVDSTSVASPANLTLKAGAHTVIFPQVKGYLTPSARSIEVFAGKLAYAYGVYYPIKVVIIVTPQSFNATKVSAIHGITPVVWVNTSSQTVTLQGTSWNVASINPGGNFTYVYQDAGLNSFEILGNGGVSGQVNVS
jgi:hypothetical protein